MARVAEPWFKEASSKPPLPKLLNLELCKHLQFGFPKGSPSFPEAFFARVTVNMLETFALRTKCVDPETLHVRQLWEHFGNLLLLAGGLWVQHLVVPMPEMNGTPTLTTRK